VATLRECLALTALPQERWLEAAMPFPGRRYGRIAPSLRQRPPAPS